MNWIKATQENPHPTKETLYLVYHKSHNYKLLWWNSEEECWDDEDGDDFYCNDDMVSHWCDFEGPART
jgi:hypothetical protein